MGDGTITREYFNQSLVSFLAVLSKHERYESSGSWTLQTVKDRPKEQFLMKKQLKNCQQFEGYRSLDEDKSFNMEEDNACFFDDINVVTETLNSLPGDNIPVTFEYHIVYSPSFSVPVLFFNAFHLSGKLLTLDEIWSIIPAIYQNRLQEEKWTFITQQEHPCLGRPFFMLHPCHTAELVSKLASEVVKNQNSKWNYLITWLSAVGPVLGLDIPLQCGLE